MVFTAVLIVLGENANVEGNFVKTDFIFENSNFYVLILACHPRNTEVLVNVRPGKK